MDATPNAGTPGDGLPIGCLRGHDPNAELVIIRGEGVQVWDEQGREYIDLTSSYSATNFGHAPERLIQIATQQMQTLSLVCGWQTPWRSKLVDRISRIAPVLQPAKTWLCTTGARAIEVAWKLAYRARPGRILNFEHAYHGRSLATATISATRRSGVFQEYVQDPLPFPYRYRGESESERLGLEKRCLAEIDARLTRDSSSISAIVIEPVLGANGYLSASDTFFQNLRQMTERLGILMISDEVQMGLGRLGSLFVCDSQGWQPDLLVLGKSLGGGLLPISAVVGEARLLDLLEVGVESETFAGNPLACRVALEVLEMLESTSILENARRLGETLRSGLVLLLERLNETMVVSGKGVYAVIEVESTSMEEAAKKARFLAAAARDAGVLLHLSGPHRNRLVFIPALTMEMRWIGQILQRLEDAWSGTLQRDFVAWQDSVDGPFGIWCER